jgi:hypothetical protein
VIVIASQEMVTDHALNLMIRSFEPYETGKEIILATHFNRREVRTAQSASKTLCEPSDLMRAIVRS